MRALRLFSMFAVALLAPALSAAAELLDGKLFVGGYGGAVFARTLRNGYGAATPDGATDASFSLAVISRQYDDLVLGASVQVNDGGSTDLDWAFVEWRLADAFRLRAGKLKQPFGLYSEIHDVGTLRPFFNLPQAVYGPIGATAEAYVGAGATGRLGSSGGWGLQYDLYGGELRLSSIELAGLLAPGATPAPPVEQVDTLDRMLGARLTVSTPIRGLSAQLSAYRARRVDLAGGAVAQVAAGPSLEYLDGALSARAEYVHLTQGIETLDAGYVEVARYLGEHLQLAARGEAAQSRLSGIAAGSFGRHREAALGVNYWANSDVAFKASFHLLDGNRLVLPDRVGPGDRPTARGWALMLGTQFTL